MKIRIFVNSTQKEFQNERRDVAHFVSNDPLLRDNYDMLTLLEELPTAHRCSDEIMLEMIQNSDILITLIGSSYGTPNEDGLSIPHLEYRKARKLGKPILVFIKDPTHAHRDNKVDEWISEVQKEGLQYKRFTDVTSLITEVYSSLFHLLDKKELLIPSEEKEDSKVFIVHGRDEKTLYKTARFLEKLVPEIIILSERPSKGKTVIEKFEHYSDVGYAVVLLTGDDKGALIGTPARKHSLRARQNVIFELGYFIGKIGRDKVCALYSPGVELPSDYAGVVYIFFDENGAWRLTLSKELKAAGVPIDLNAVLE